MLCGAVLPTPPHPASSPATPPRTAPRQTAPLDKILVNMNILYRDCPQLRTPALPSDGHFFSPPASPGPPLAAPRCTLSGPADRAPRRHQALRHQARAMRRAAHCDVTDQPTWPPMLRRAAAPYPTPHTLPSCALPRRALPLTCTQHLPLDLFTFSIMRTYYRPFFF